jgi:hypothetical protein
MGISMMRKKLIFLSLFLVFIGLLSSCNNMTNTNQSIKVKKQSPPTTVEEMTKTPHDSTSR